MPGTDFNGDGRDDIVWRHTSSGLVTNWLGQPNGSFISNDATGLDPWAHGELVGVGDFNADGRSDTLWRDTDELFLSPTDPGGSFSFFFNMGFVAKVAVSWNVVGTGDFNADGHDDILWRHDSGLVTTWLAKPTDDYSFNTANVLIHVDTSWQVAGTGDFNEDGHSDVLWRHSSGLLTNWLGQAGGGFAANNANALVQVDTSWQVAGIGDFNGDGQDDVLWRHVSGWLTNWLAEADGGFAPNNDDALEFVDLTWRIVGAGDYNGDGRDDVLWHHASGHLTDWLGQASGGFVANIDDAWHLAANGWLVQPNPSGAGEWDY